MDVAALRLQVISTFKELYLALFAIRSYARRNVIVHGGLHDRLYLALFAIRSYARRNVIAHGGLHGRSLSNDSAGLAEYIDNDVKLLEEILPDDEKLMVDNWPTPLY